MAVDRFPPGFLWGAATSAHQIEGARHEDGRGASIWDDFADPAGTFQEGSDPEVACDHYHLWPADLERMRWLGLKAYRFSIAWPRVLPEGRGRVNPAGLDFYDRLVDALLEAKIQPYPTLYHWDLPSALQEGGGWSDRAIVDAFVEYASLVVARLGDRIGSWITHNEPWCIATLGYEEGQHAPGHRDPSEALRAAHHLLLSHGRAAEEIRARFPAAKVGIVLNYCPAHAASSKPADQDAARWFDGFFNRWYLNPLFRGSYPADGINDRILRGHLQSSELPFVQDGDMVQIATPLDFLGLNYYSRVIMKAEPDGHPTATQTLPTDELTDMGWEVYPEGLRESLLRIHREYRPREIYVTENGAAFPDHLQEDGRIHDHRRTDYLHDHLVEASRAIEEGAPLRGYFVWSLMDNLEWGHGHAMRFGIFANDFVSQERRPKDSAYWYRKVIEANTVVDVSSTVKQGESRVSDA